MVPRLARHLEDTGVSGAFVGGTTGEWASLGHQERVDLAASWRKAASSKLKVIVHVGHNALSVAQDLARHAESIGADAIGALMPSFFRPRTLAAAVEFSRRIAEAAPKTPFYYYHIPDMTGVDFSMADFLPLAARNIPSFAGIKFTHSNLMDYSLTLAAAAGRFDIFFGRDECLLAGLAMGGHSAVGSTYNYSALLYHKLIQLHNAGKREEAAQQQVYIQKVIVPLLRVGSMPAGKAIMAAIGLDCGPARPPFEPLPPDKLAPFKAELTALDFFRQIAPSTAAPVPASI